MRTMRLVIALGLACAAAPTLVQGQTAEPSAPQGQVQGQAEEAPPPNPQGRYSFNRVDDGFLRLDTVTGQVASCSRHSAGWVCQAVPEERAALEKEIARLQDQVTGPQNEVAALRETAARHARRPI